MKDPFRIILMICMILVIHCTQGQSREERVLVNQLTSSAQKFLTTLGPENKILATLPFAHEARFDWNYTPRKRNGVTFKTMIPAEREAGMALLKAVMSEAGFLKSTQIIALEEILRHVENRTNTDLYRDPDNYSFLIFGEPGSAVWSWRFEGHHLSLHFSIVDGQLRFMPGFMGSNPATVLADVKQKGLRVLHEEQDLAFALLQSFSVEQQKMAVLSIQAPADLLSTNVRKVTMDQQEGITYQQMTAAQQKQFQKLIQVYLKRYHVTLKNQQWAQLEKEGLAHLRFAWMGDLKAEIGPGHGHYYRIQGPSIFIEFDNTQNGGNHIHSVVRDLKNDFGEDLLRLHYEKNHSTKK
jgi:hypothetical protein